MRTKNMLSYLLFFSFAISTFANEMPATLLNSTKVQSYTQEQIKAILKEKKIPGIMKVKNGVDVYEVLYTTSWHDGSPVRASGFLYLPTNFTKKPSVVTYAHGTQMERHRKDIWENEGTIAMLFACDGYVVSMPDYVGLGKGDKFHLYLHAQTEATAQVDMLYAVYEILRKTNTETDGRLFSTGYSQGGHASMAFARYLESNKPAGLEITASSPMSGPYDISGVQSTAMVQEYPYPSYLPYLLNSYQEVYKLVDEGEKIYKEPYDSIVKTYYTGEHSMFKVNKMLPAVPIDMVTDTFKQLFLTDPEFKMHYAVKDNNVYDWKPEKPLQLCYCKYDEQVDYRNAYVAMEAMKKNGSDKVFVRNGGNKFNHRDCAVISFAYSKFFFDSFRNGSEKGNKGNVGKRMAVGIYKGFVKPSPNRKK